MAHFIRVRDIEQPSTINEFAEAVKDPERLGSLTLLTWADVNAVSHNVWSPTQDTFLRELFRRTVEVLEGEPVPELDTLAAAVVEAFDPFRAPLTEAEIQRRNPDALNPEEFRNLCQWGYPYVFKTFRFHMTLTGRVGAEEAPRVRAALEEVIAPSLAHPVPIDSLSLFVEPESGAPFTVSSSHALGGIRQRMTA